jgi:cytochrome c oxidase subunit IV
MSSRSKGPTLRTYINVFVVLVLLTIATYEAAHFNFGNHVLNVLVAMLIAMTKAAIVILYFMHVKYSSRLVWIFVITGFLWLILLIVGTLHDVLSRAWLG